MAKRFEIQEAMGAIGPVYRIWDLQASDGLDTLHYGPIIGREEAEELAELLNSFNERPAKRNKEGVE